MNMHLLLKDKDNPRTIYICKSYINVIHTTFSIVLILQYTYHYLHYVEFSHFVAMYTNFVSLNKTNNSLK